VPHGYGTTVRRRTPPVVVAVLVLSVVAAAAPAHGDARTAAAPRPVLTVVPPRAFVGELVVASVLRSGLPRASPVKRLLVNWGDGSKSAKLARLTARPRHRYVHPGRFTISELLVNRHGQARRVTYVEEVAARQHLYWDLFNGAIGLQDQVESAPLPLTERSRAAELSGTAMNQLQCTSGMTTDENGRLWILSSPKGCSAPYGTDIQVFTLPLTRRSAPVLTFALPLPGDDDNLVFDRHGDLWVEDAYDSTVYEFTGPFESSATLEPAVTLTEGIQHPSGIAVDAEGDVFVANEASGGADSIAVFRAPVTSATMPFFLDGLQSPGGLTFDSRGDLYASSNPSDGVGTAIVRYNRDDLVSGATPSVIDGVQVGGDHGLPYESNFAWDALGNLYVADCSNASSLRVYPLGTSPFTATTAPGVVYTNDSIATIGCVWGIAVR
jgi:hypothetical protein